MSEKYFEKFPSITYNNTTCLDITRKVDFTDKTRSIPTLFYPHELKSGLRADLLAYSYYDDSYYDWLIYITNGIIDPYYDWYLSENNFEAFLVNKYGSIENAIQRILYYELNWTTEESEISVNYYDNNIPEVLKKYWSPNYGDFSRIIAYTRRKADWQVNTNRIIKFDIADANGSFTIGERLHVIQSNTQYGNAEVVSANSTAVFAQHIAGNVTIERLDNRFIFSSSNGAYLSSGNGSILGFDVYDDTTLLGNTSQATATITDTDLVVTNISDEEYIYWTPVSAYDYENEKNEKNKFVHLLDASYALDVAEGIRKKLKE